MPQIKRIDLTEFWRLGFLQEANRQFFHPLGLALEVVQEADGTISKLGGVWDFRDDPEGMSFGELAGPDVIEKARHVATLRESKAQTRIKTFGGIVQPIPQLDR